ncbi:hypothetical protein HGRIS_010215 [Hohenbuehelia grisea]
MASDLRKPTPDTGWRGSPAVPSSQGGDAEVDFIHKPPYDWMPSNKDLFVPRFICSCWCGNVQFEFHGEALDAKCCHCRDCQRLHGAPFQWAVIFPKTSVRMTKNENHSVQWFSTDIGSSCHYVPCKVSCGSCKSPLFDEGRNTVLAYPSAFQFPSAIHNGERMNSHNVPDDLRPTCHIFYGQRIMDISDGIPKWEGHKNSSTSLS